MLDPVLAAFVEVADDEEAERRLASLLDTDAIPLVRAIATRKLRTYGTSGFRAEDVDDVVGDVMVVLIDRLSALRREPEAEPIHDLRDYTASVTYNVCAHYIRRKHPERARLKNRLRYLLSHRDRLAVWDVAGEGAICGLAAWRSQAIDASAMDVLQQLDAPAAAAASARAVPLKTAALKAPPSIDAPEALASFVETIFATIGGPVELDALVTVVARLCRVEEPRLIVEPIERAAIQPSGDSLLDQRRAVERAWAEIGELPPRQRVALLLNLRDANGSSLLWVLPLTGIASIRQIARMLGWADLELAEIWKDLPLDDNTIAGRLGCTRQQVINLRMAAKKRLANRQERHARAPEGRSSSRANLTPVSSSSREDA
jgi:hypothetical protein